VKVRVAHADILGAMKKFRILIEYDRESDCWVTIVPALDGISTFGATRDEAISNTRELIQGYYEAAAKEGLKVEPSEPESIDLEVAVACESCQQAPCVRFFASPAYQWMNLRGSLMPSPLTSPAISRNLAPF
jgi:predicted RNase H-like HicB family nuclease